MFDSLLNVPNHIQKRVTASLVDTKEGWKKRSISLIFRATALFALLEFTSGAAALVLGRLRPGTPLLRMLPAAPSHLMLADALLGVSSLVLYVLLSRSRVSPARATVLFIAATFLAVPLIYRDTASALLLGLTYFIVVILGGIFINPLAAPVIGGLSAALLVMTGATGMMDVMMLIFGALVAWGGTSLFHRMVEIARVNDEKMRALMKTAQEISGRLDSPEIMELVADRARRLLVADVSRIYVLREDGATLWPAAASAPTAKGAGTSARVGEGITGWVVDRNTPQMVNHAQRDPRFASAHPGADTCILCAPLNARGRAIGAVEVQRVGGEEFTRNDLEFLVTLSQYAAVALDNTRLYEETRGTLEETATLYRASRALVRARTEEEMAAGILGEMLSVLDVEQASIMLFEESGREIRRVIYDRTGCVGEFEVREEEVRPLGTLLGKMEQPLWVECPPQVPLPPVISSRFREAGIRAMLIMPLTMRGEKGGFVSLESTRAKRRFNDDEVALAQAMVDQLSVALENMRLHDIAVKRVEQELEIARNIQMSLLPREAPDVSRLEIATYFLPARHVGGDFYDYFLLDGQRRGGQGKSRSDIMQDIYSRLREPEQFSMGLAVGDVSGKGIPSSLFMAVSISALWSQARIHHDVSRLLERLAAILYPQAHTGGINTALLYARFEGGENGSIALRVANAGLISPILKRGGGTIEWVDSFGPPLGTEMALSGGYRSTELQMFPGDVAVFVSDGLPEAMNDRGELFGFERLETAVSRSSGGSARMVVDRLVLDMQEFAGKAEQHDDLTIVAVRIRK